MYISRCFYSNLEPVHNHSGTASAVVPGTKISSHGGNDKAWVWSAMDFSDGEQKLELLAIRFGTPESAFLLTVASC